MATNFSWWRNIKPGIPFKICFHAKVTLNDVFYIVFIGFSSFFKILYLKKSIFFLVIGETFHKRMTCKRKHEYTKTKKFKRNVFSYISLHIFELLTKI